ncbi:MAG: ABC transporter ATP-binding protein [Desulfobacterales bacterium]
MSTILSVENLRTYFHTRKGVVKAVDGVSLQIDSGQAFGIVGESGAGKSITGFSIIRLIDPPGKIESGTIRLAGRDILSLNRKRLRHLRGSEVSMIFQDPQTSLNPVLSIRRQMMETLSFHNPELSRRELLKRSLDKLNEVGLPAPRERLKAFPHQLSGGMKQRIVIAMALLNNPKLLIADEPTTALDVTIQAQILLLMKRLCREHGSAMILITHDIGVVAQMCDMVAVMYAGRIVECGTREMVLSDPLHPYTRGLIQCLPKRDYASERLVQIQGVMPSLLSLPEGCYFRDRCPEAGEDCLVYPEERCVDGRRVACHRIP